MARAQKKKAGSPKKKKTSAKVASPKVDDNLSSVGNFSAGTTWRLMTESGKMDDDAIKLSSTSEIFATLVLGTIT